MPAEFEKIFPNDKLSKRERVERTLNLQPVDRVALHDRPNFNPDVIALYTGREIKGFDYTIDDVSAVIRQTLDMCFPPTTPVGTERVTSEEGFVFQRDNWTVWTVKRPFHDEEGGRDWLLKRIEKMQKREFNPEKARREYREEILNLQHKVGETVIFYCPVTTNLEIGFADNTMGLEIFSYFYAAYPEIFHQFLDISVNQALEWIHAVADKTLTPVAEVSVDFATKQGPIFSPAFLEKNHYPYVKRLTDAWHSHGLKVIYHSDGNYKKVIPDLIKCGVDGFYCLEPNCGMDIVELKKTWPQMVWAGGVDGVDLLERGSPEEVREEVHRHIRETNALQTGGMFVGSSSNITPPIKPENFAAMVKAAGELFNPDWI